MGTSSTHAWDRIAPRYEWAIRCFGSRYDAVRLRLRRDLDGSDLVLELAAGTGQFTLDIASAAGRLLATDLAPAMLERLRARVAAAAVDTVEVRPMSATSIDAPDASFDAVVAANLLHVMPGPRDALREVRRVLRPGGLLLAPTFCHGQTPMARATSSILSLVSPFVAHTRFTARSLERLVDDAGFGIEMVEILGGWLPEVYVRAHRPSGVR